MTTLTDVPAPVPVPAASPSPDHRGSWIPTGPMIRTRIMELRKRRGLMITMALVMIGIPTVFLGIRLLLHGVDPKTYGPAGGYDIYTAFVSGVLYVFGFILAATLGVTAGSSDLTDGMFRHLVVTGRSRLALYLARIPAGLAIIIPVVAAGFTIVCAVCVFAAPTRVEFNGLRVPANLSRAGLENWAAGHPSEVICDGPNVQIGPNDAGIGTTIQNFPCNNGPNPGGGPTITKQGPGPQAQPQPVSHAQAVQAARFIAGENYGDYTRHFLYPSYSLMIKSGLWLELEVLIGFVVGLGLGSLLGQRTVAVILLIVLEIVLTPILSRAKIAHLINLQRAVVGLATAHLAPGGLPVLGGGGGGPGGGGGNPGLVPESTTVAVCVIVAWLVGWSVIGAWRMMTRDT